MEIDIGNFWSPERAGRVSVQQIGTGIWHVYVHWVRPKKGKQVIAETDKEDTAVSIARKKYEKLKAETEGTK